MDKILEDIVTTATEELRDLMEARDDALNKARRARMLSKQAIQYLNSKQTKKAENILKEASKLLKGIIKFSEPRTELQFFNQVETARQEYSEASILFSLSINGGFPRPEELEVPYTDYLMGLADVPGELRRQTLNHLQEEEMEQAKRNLEHMEEIFLNLTAMEEGSLLLKGMRRKMDIIRMVNEKTLADITNELSRQKLSQKLEELRHRLK